MKKTQTTPEESQQVDEEVSQMETSISAKDGDNEIKRDSADKESEELKAKVAELNDKFLRQAAEFENFKRRNAKERIDLIQTAGRDVITDLLDVMDDSDR